MSTFQAVMALRAAHRARGVEAPRIVRLGVDEQRQLLTEMADYTDSIQVADEGPPLCLERVTIDLSHPLVRLYGMTIEPVLQASLLEVGTRGRWPKWTAR